MVKVLLILHKRSDMDGPAFNNYWRNTHARLVAGVPGVARYTQSFPYPDYDSPLPADGVEELKFESLMDMQNALGSPEGAAMRHDLPNFCDMSRSGPIVIEEDREVL